MIVIASKEEKELIKRLREFEKPAELIAEVNRLKRELSALEIDKAKIKEAHEREERELRHMIGLEKKRQEFETKKASEEAVLKVREENLKVEKARFEQHLKFNTERFEKMETYLKDMFSDVLKRLPNVNVELNRKR